MDKQILLCSIANMAPVVLNAVLEANDITDKKGGFLALRFRGDAAPFLLLKEGEPLVEKHVKYSSLAPEKAGRALLPDGNVSSWQTRDPENGKWGGGICPSGEWAMAFSGLPELADEAFCLILARLLGMLSAEDADRIASISNNEMYRKAVTRFDFS
ncbi:MAG: hypothetical protein ABIH21_03135 [Patescibacteria group bacterium]